MTPPTTDPAPAAAPIAGFAPHLVLPDGVDLDAIAVEAHFGPKDSWHWEYTPNDLTVDDRAMVRDVVDAFMRQLAAQGCRVVGPGEARWDRDDEGENLVRLIERILNRYELLNLCLDQIHADRDDRDALVRGIRDLWKRLYIAEDALAARAGGGGE